MRKDPNAVRLGRKGGLSKSPAKVAAVRENGKKGGRPKKERFETVVGGGVALVEPERDGQYNALLKALDAWELKKQAGETIGDDDIIESLGVRGRVKLFALRDRRRGETRPVGGKATPNDA